MCVEYFVCADSRWTGQRDRCETDVSVMEMVIVVFDGNSGSRVYRLIIIEVLMFKLSALKRTHLIDTREHLSHPMSPGFSLQPTAIYPIPSVVAPPDGELEANLLERHAFANMRFIT